MSPTSSHWDRTLNRVVAAYEAGADVCTAPEALYLLRSHQYRLNATIPNYDINPLTTGLRAVRAVCDREGYP